MRSLPSGLTSLLATGSTAIVRLVKVTRRDGTIIRFAETDVRVTVSGETFQPGEGLIVGSIPFGIDGYASGLDLTVGTASSTVIAINDVRNGAFDGATAEVWAADAINQSAGSVSLFRGWVSNVSVEREGKAVISFKSLLNRSGAITLEYYSSMCRAMLGDSRCKIDLSDSGSWTKPADIATIVNPYEFTVTNWTDARAVDGWYRDGLAGFTSGPMAGKYIEIRDWIQSTQTVKLFLPMEMTPAVGDHLRLFPGCDKTVSMCAAKFGNVVNFRGEPNSPGKAAAAQYSAGGGTVATVPSPPISSVDMAAGTITWGPINIGTPSSDRLVVIVIYASRGTTPGRSISSVTIAGSGASIHVQSDPTSVEGVVGIASATVTSGSSIYISASMSGAVTEIDSSVYILRGLASNTPSATASNAAAGSDAATTINVPFGGTVIGGFVGVGGTLNPVSWTGIGTKVSDSLGLQGASDRISTAYQQGMSSQTGRPISVTSASTDDALAVVAWGGTSVGATGGATVSPATGSVTVTGNAPTISAPNNVFVSPSTGSLTVTGNSPNVTNVPTIPSFPASGAVGSTVGGSGMSAESSVAVVTSGGQSDPAGGTTAGKIVSSSPSTGSNVRAGIAATNTLGTQTTFSAFVKPNGCNYASMGFYDGAGIKFVAYDLVGHTVLGGSGYDSAGVIDYGSGWVRIWFTRTAGSAGNSAPYGVWLCPKTTNSADETFGVTTSGIGIYFWHIEAATGSLDS